MSYIFKKSTISFRRKVTISLIIMSLIMAVYMGIASYRLSSNIVFDMSKRISEESFKLSSKMLDNYFHNVNNNTTRIIRLPILREILHIEDIKNTKTTYTRQLDLSVRELLSFASSTDKITFDILNIFCRNDFTFEFRKNKNLPYNDYQSCIEYYSNKGFIDIGYTTSSWSELVKTIDITGRETFTIINIRILYDEVTLEKLGILITGINEKDLSDIYSSSSDKAFILGNNGQVISNLDKSLLGKSYANDELYIKIFNSKKYMDTIIIQNDNYQMVTFKKLAGNDLIFIVPFDFYSGNEIIENKSFAISMLILMLIGFATSIIFAILLSKGLSSSLLSLKKTVQAVSEGNLDARFISDNSDEVSYLGNKFNQMLDQINKYIDEQMEQEKIKKKLELKLMQSQINPHLLYNTLDSVMWSLEKRNTSQAKKLIESLSDFFKLSLSFGNTLIPIQKELELVNSYIFIQNISRNKNISLNIISTNDLNEIMIPKLSIQPIVENAIVHGFHGFRDDGIISIEIKSIENNMIQLIIEDNGIGISENELEQINKMFEDYSYEPESKHFGLYNVHRRIINLLGNQYGIRLESEIGNYTRVVINMTLISKNTKGF